MPIDTVIPVSREELNVTSEWVDTARIRIRKEVHTIPQQVELTLGAEEVDIQRVPMDQFVEHAPEARYEGDTLVVPILEEVLVVEKRLRLKEELRITRLRKETAHAATVPVRVEEAVVERFDQPSDQPRTE